MTEQVKKSALKRFGPSLLVAALAVAAAGFGLQQWSTPKAMAAVEAGFGPDNYTEAESFADTLVGRRQALLSASPDEWLPQEALALALLNRFSLTGDQSDVDEAQRLLDAGLESVAYPAGPTLSRAQAALVLHDLDRADSALKRYSDTVVKVPEESAAFHAMRGDIDFQRGDLSKAASEFQSAHAIAPTFGSSARLANIALWKGEPEAALDIGQKGLIGNDLSPSGVARASLIMANFAYAKGDVDTAGQWIDRASRAFTGYWLVEAYAAQHLAAEGQWDKSIAALETVARRSAEPEVYDVLAGILAHRGREGEAAAWTARATKAWEEKLAESEPAYRLHAAEHYLDFGDTARALELARAEVAERPFGEAIEVAASAYLAQGQTAEALRWLDMAEKKGFRSVSLDMARAETLQAMGRDEEAEKFVRRAETLNPNAAEPLRKLLRFGHY